MIGISLHRAGGGVAACLAALSMLLQVAVPSGFMVGSAHGAPTIVICTGHGPLVVGSPETPSPHKAPKSDGSGACAFAGHGGFAPAIAIPIPTPQRTALVRQVDSPARDLSPGRGLAAPPPPSQGPPRVSI